MNRLVRVLFIVVFSFSCLCGAGVERDISEAFNTEAKRTEWWNGLEYQWKLAFNKLLGYGKSVRKPEDVRLEGLLCRKALLLYSSEITNLSGVKNLTHIENLSCSYNKITNIQGLKNLTNLKILKLSDNRIKSLEILKNLKDLEYLRVDFNDLQDLKGLEELSKLNRVYADNNFISSLAPLADKPELEELYINDNSIVSLLPLKNNTKLKMLQASNNQLQNIDGLSSLENLEKVYIFNNNLVSLEGVQNLRKLDIFAYSENSEILPDEEKDKVRDLFAKKKKFRVSIASASVSILIFGLVIVFLVKLILRIRVNRKRRREFLRLHKLFLDKTAGYFDNDARLYQWWENLNHQWRRVFNVELDNGASLFVPKPSDLRKILTITFLEINVEDLSDLSGLNNCTELRYLRFYNEKQKFLDLFSNIEFLNRFPKLEKLRFSTGKIRKIKNFAKLNEKFRVAIPENESDFVKSGSIIELPCERRLRYKYPIVAIGNFEGLHLGHAKILNRLYSRAQDTGGEALILTYKVHTREHFLKLANKPIAPYMVLDKKHKENLLFHKFGVHSILYLDFEQGLSELPAEEFFKTILVDKLHIREIICGYDTRFGKGREGDYKLLLKLSEPYKIRVRLVEPLLVGGKIVRSELIRDMIKNGEIAGIKNFLSRPYSISGTVMEGKKIGGVLGFPTLNVKPIQEYKLYPPKGVYITHTFIGGIGYYGLTNIGFAPTIRDSEKTETIENYLYKFKGKVYGQEVNVVFLKFLRDEKKFASRKELVEQIKIDLEKLKRYIRVH